MKYLGKFFLYFLLAVLVFIIASPFLLTIFTAFKDPSLSLTTPWIPPLPPTLENITSAWFEGNFGVYFKNSVIISCIDSVLMVVIVVLAGYAFSFLKFKGSNAILNYFLLGIIVPPTAIIIPLFVIVRNLGLYNSHWGVIVSDIALAMPMFIFIIRGFMITIPQEVRESGKLDGANELTILSRLIFPMVKPAVITIMLLEFIWSWNDLLLRMVFLTKDAMRTMTVGLLFFQGNMTRNVHGITAGTVIMMIIPTILFMFFRRQFMTGMTAGAVKG